MTSESIPVEIRGMTPEDVSPVQELLGRIPQGEHAFLHEDIRDPQVVEGWARDAESPDRNRLIAFVDGMPVGIAAVVRGRGWSGHVGHLHLVVEPAHRGRGLARALARAALAAAVQLQVTKLVVEVVADQEPTVAMFAGLGFEPEGLFKDQVQPPDGGCHDLLVLSHFVEEMWSTMATVGIDEAVQTG
ncbi:MAG TPA: GNAT family N-acetyltransferase [Marmoricola sp.]|nr:GNAT family N-acetyltransferase [Marmoricola sp.]